MSTDLTVPADTGSLDPNTPTEYQSQMPALPTQEEVTTVTTTTVTTVTATTVTVTTVSTATAAVTTVTTTIVTAAPVTAAVTTVTTTTVTTAASNPVVAQTTLTAEIPAGTTTLPTPTTANFVAGKQVVLNEGGTTEEVVTIATLTSRRLATDRRLTTGLTLTTPTQYVHGVGTTITMHQTAVVPAHVVQPGNCQEGGSAYYGGSCNCGVVASQDACWIKGATMPTMAAIVFITASKECHPYQMVQALPLDCPAGCTAIAGTKTVVTYAGDSVAGKNCFIKANSANTSVTTTRPPFFHPEVNTTLTVATAPANSVIQVASTVGFKLGREIIIDMGTPKEEIRKIIALGSISLDARLNFAHGVGASVIMPGQATLSRTCSANACLNAAGAADAACCQEKNVGDCQSHYVYSQDLSNAGKCTIAGSAAVAYKVCCRYHNAHDRGVLHNHQLSGKAAKDLGVGLLVGTGLALGGGVAASVAATVGHKHPSAYLLENAPTGDTKIDVSNHPVFKVGDYVLLGPSITNQIIGTEGTSSLLLKTPLTAAAGKGTPVTIYHKEPGNVQTVSGIRSREHTQFEQTPPPFQSSGSSAFQGGESSGFNSNVVGGMLFLIALCCVCAGCGGAVLYIFNRNKNAGMYGQYGYDDDSIYGDDFDDTEGRYPLMVTGPMYPR